MSAKTRSTTPDMKKVTHLQLLTVEEVAERLSVSVRTVRRPDRLTEAPVDGDAGLDASKAAPR